MNIENKTILITGANRGIGRALVEEALRRGAQRVYAGTRGPLHHSDNRVTPLILDVTNPAQIQRAVGQVDSLDVLINNAGIAMYDDLSKPEVIEQHLKVNLFGPLNVTRAFLPLLKRSRGAIVNNLSTSALAALPIIPGYSISKAATLSMTQSLRALLAGQGVTVHAILTGPVDTDMTRSVDFPKASPESVAVAIFDGMEKGEEEIFPDPMSQAIAEGWRNGVAKALERQSAVFVPESAASAS
jgi:NAD(P)-dependent dehydrogenase (short-subunit alcohol dehydrogenase family)